MITIKNKSALRKMEEAGKLLSQLFEDLKIVVRAGISTLELDKWITEQLIARGLESRTKGYRGYRHASCISINDEVVHGVPTAEKILKEGDLVKIDICASWQGYCADMARPFAIGTLDATVLRLVEATQRSLDKGIEQVYPGNHLTDISAAIQSEVETNGYGVVRDFAGHGIGKRMHEDPEILNYGTPGKGPIIRAGMAFAIEPMVTMGDFRVYVANDGWTVRTRDRSIAAHVEDTVIVTEQGPRAITRFHA